MRLPGIILMLCLVSCHKNPGGGVSATGIVYDSVLHQPIQGATVYLIGVQSSNSILPVFDTGYLASARTDAQGNFSIGYHPQGNYIAYQLALIYYHPATFINFLTRACIPDTVGSTYFFPKDSLPRDVVLRGRTLEPAHMAISDSRSDTLMVRVLSTAGWVSDYLFTDLLPVDTAFTIQVLPNSPNYIEYYKGSLFAPVEIDTLLPLPNNTLQFTHQF
ncbi:peptidase associated/transthyretin-like domain-containing protein [Dinghuibacter silviterrae]|uniref:Carboxypeptidase family protein n=1 Tax=Dinghuibacter silviterrae TaxID=1539049 RepID=A0A4R8DIA8_9BACT|nr:carboxypeptidase-like regulatory domain-containing protein [Dinghuibacter silviterrae]TDW97297.1 hypothetical protein EDB95_5144 [Dinghuibacter silviterrae]